MTWERAAGFAIVGVAVTGLVWWLAGELADRRDRRRGHAAARHASRDEDEAVPQQRESGRAA